MSDYSSATGAPLPTMICGKEYRVYKLRPRDVGEMEAWFRSVAENPKTEARKYMEGLPENVAIHIWDEACRQPWPPRMEDEAGQQLLVSPEGQARALWIILRRGFPDGQFSLEMARDLSDDMTLEETMAVVRMAGPGDPDDPLSTGETTTATTTETVPESIVTALTATTTTSGGRAAAGSSTPNSVTALSKRPDGHTKPLIA